MFSMPFTDIKLPYVNYRPLTKPEATKEEQEGMRICCKESNAYSRMR
jgi:hypothetical protein